MRAPARSTMPRARQLLSCTGGAAPKATLRAAAHRGQHLGLDQCGAASRRFVPTIVAALRDSRWCSPFRRRPTVLRVAVRLAFAATFHFVCLSLWMRDYDGSALVLPVVEEPRYLISMSAHSLLLLAHEVCCVAQTAEHSPKNARSQR
jgi:hypothetical protein